jgi:hypothetical protein
MPPKKKPISSTGTGKGAGASRGGKGGRKAPPPMMIAKPKPWGLIGLTMVVVLFAAGVIGYAVFRVNESAGETPQALADRAKQMEGVTYIEYPGGEHNDGTITYDQSPPFGGQHANAWADCTGTVYPNPIRSENAVHALEHGAVWITYQPDLPEDQVSKLAGKVDGVAQMMLSPYPGLKSKVSLQSWGYQLFVDDANDPRIDDFIKDLRLNSVTTPEYGASCANPTFKASPLPPDPTAPAGSATPAPSGSGSPAPAPTASG